MFIFELTFSTRAPVLQVIKGEEETDSGPWAPLAEALRKEEKTEEPAGKSILWPEVDTPHLLPPMTNHMFLINYR